jgi:hypothetical protein
LWDFSAGSGWPGPDDDDDDRGSGGDSGGVADCPPLPPLLALTGALVVTICCVSPSSGSIVAYVSLPPHTIIATACEQPTTTRSTLDLRVEKNKWSRKTEKSDED